MAEVLTREHRAGPSALSVLATIIAVMALILAWMAYNRTGPDLEAQIQQQVNEAVDETGTRANQGIDATEGVIDRGPDGVDEGTR